MNQTKTPRSAFEKVGGIYFLGRTIDKIRLLQCGELKADYLPLMGKGFDNRIMAFLGLDYEQFATFVRNGATDEQCWAWCEEYGRKLNEHTTLVWNDFAAKRGWRDSAAELLVKFKAEAGLSHRDDLQTLFDLWEVEEGRKP